MENRTYIAIDLKSFYASVECVERGLDPLTANLVVADTSRTEKTICLAVSPSMKAYGIPGRARLFEVVERVRQINAVRQSRTSAGAFSGSSFDDKALRADRDLKLDYIAAVPRMSFYMAYSARIYGIYLKYVAEENIHVYSIDEVFMDVTDHLKTSGLTAEEFAMNIILDVLKTTGITATAGIGSNLYLCKIAMDVKAKKIPPDKNGVRIARLDEMSYRRELWDHRPLTDFWRLGRGYAKKLEDNGLFTMGDIARCSLGRPEERYNEELLYKLFGVNAELLIDHAWGFESCTIADIKSYRPESSSISSGQVLQEPYEYDKAKLIVREMADAMSLELLEKRLVTDQLVLTLGYDTENLADESKARLYKGEVKTDAYGRKIPKHANGSIRLKTHTSSARLITEAAVGLMEEIADRALTVRRINITANHVISETDKSFSDNEQLDMFTDYEELAKRKKREEESLEKERRRQQAVLDIRKRYGKNAIMRGMNLQEGATMRKRNGQIGGHKA
ncbi:MAG: DNA methylase [Eubacteriales bacterium]|nr:DNA methylase [Eubacteriales bacterium]